MRRYQDNEYPILGVPKTPEDLPEAEPILPGHTLIRPSLTMLKSAVKYPLRDIGGAAVYGNLDNLGITYDKTNQRILYTDFRKANDLLDVLFNAVQNINKHNGANSKPTLVVIETKPLSLVGNNENSEESSSHILVPEEENNASEILDEEEQSGENNEDRDYRRRRSKKSKYREHSSYESSKDGDTTSSASSDYEKNPGNPFTVHKNKYLQNYMWNHKMDGDHMNINPFGPQFKGLGPSGADMFFIRKWWYYNQDDYKPF